MTDEADGSPTVCFRAAGLLQIAYHLMTWGPSVAILAPNRLKVLMWKEVESSRRALSQDATETSRGKGSGRMIGAFAAHGRSVGIFWVVETGPGEARLLTTGCSLEAAEPYGDFLTFAGGHYEVWEGWRKIKDHNPALRTVVRTFEYEDWPRGRIVFDQVKERFVLYADRKLMLPDTITQIRRGSPFRRTRRWSKPTFTIRATKRQGLCLRRGLESSIASVPGALRP